MLVTIQTELRVSDMAKHDDHTRLSQEPMPVWKLHISQRSSSSGPGNHKPVALRLPGPHDAPHWEMCDFHMGTGSCFYPMACVKHQNSHADIARFCTPLFCMNCVLFMA